MCPSRWPLTSSRYISSHRKLSSHPLSARFFPEAGLYPSSSTRRLQVLPDWQPLEKKQGGTLMLKAHFPVGRLTFILGVLLLASGGVKATTISLGANVGTFSYTVTSDIFDCNDLYTYTRYDFNNIVYTPVY